MKMTPEEWAAYMRAYRVEHRERINEQRRRRYQLERFKKLCPHQDGKPIHLFGYTPVSRSSAPSSAEAAPNPVTNPVTGPEVV